MSQGLVELVDAFTLLEEYKWGRNQALPQLLQKFTERVDEVQKNGGDLSDQYLALRLLRSSNLDKLHQCLDNINIRQLTYSEVRELVCKVYKDTGNDRKTVHSKPTGNATHKLDNITLNSSNPRQARGWSSEGDKNNNMIMGKDLTDQIKLPLRRKKQSENPGEKLPPRKIDIVTSVNSLRQGKNPANKNKVVSKCVICRSTFHWSPDCPDQSVHKVDIDPGGLEQLQEDTCDSGYNPVVITADVSKSVCGLPWLLSYLETLSPREKSKIVNTASSTDFNFREVGRVKSFTKLTIPLLREDKKQISIEVEVVERNIPLLLSRASLTRGKVKINPHADTMSISGMTMYLNLHQSGLLYLLLTSEPSSSTEVPTSQYHSSMSQRDLYNSKFLLGQESSGITDHTRSYVVNLY